MLQHEPQEQPLSIPPAQIRVTAEELAAAINALEASKDAAARHLAGTVPIGQVVEEMKLDATPEEIWTQVQKQRAQAAREAAQREEAARVRPVTMPIIPVVPDKKQARAATRRVLRGWRGIKGWVWILFWCCGGGSLFSVIPHLLHSTSAISISGDNQTFTSATLGKEVEVSGDNDTLILQGNCPTLTISGDYNHIRVEGTVRRIIADGDGNIITYSTGSMPAISGSGDGNHIGPTAP